MSYRKKHIHPKIKNLNKRPLFKRPVFWILSLSCIVLITILYFVFYFPKLYVSSIEISGNSSIPSQDITESVLNDVEKEFVNLWIAKIPRKSLFVINQSRLEAQIAKSFPKISNVDIKKEFPDKLVINIQERQKIAVYCQSGSCFSVDSHGVAFENCQKTELDVIIVSDYKEVFLGKNVVEKSVMDLIGRVKKNLEDNFKIGVLEVFVSDPLVFTTSEGWKVYFNPKAEINVQILKMNSLLKGEISEEARNSLEYIYLQYKDKAYYK